MATVEYMLLLCSMVTITCITGYFLRNLAQGLLDKIADRILDAAFSLSQ